MGRKLTTKRCEAVLDSGRLGGVDHTQDEAVGLKRLKRVGEHALAYPSDTACQFAKTMSPLQQHDQNQRAPPGRDVIEDDA